MTGHVFHPGHDELHGISVVVETPGQNTYVGRFDRQDDDHVFLKDVGVHAAVEGAESWEDYLRRTVTYGIKVEHRELTIPRAQATRIAKLSEMATGLS